MFSAGYIDLTTTGTQPEAGAPVLVSACLLGVRCAWDGSEKRSALPGATRVLPVCPEYMAGMGIPRPPIEREADGRVRVVHSGEDVTDRLAQACDSIVRKARKHGVRRAILKRKSPSCGTRELWRRGELVAGQGLLTERLRAVGITVEGAPR